MIDRIWLTGSLVASILEEYKSATTDHAKAVLEQRLWALVSPRMRQEYVRRDFLRELLGGSAYQYSLRGALLNAPDFIWDRIEAGMSLRAASDIMLASKSSGDVNAQLARYDSQPHTRVLASGKIARMVSPGQRLIRGQGRTKRATGEWSKVRTFLSDILRSRLGKLADTFEAERLIDDFDHELQAAIQSFTTRVQRIKSNNVKPVSRRQALDACNILHMDPPKMGLPCDLALAKGQMRKFVKTYHPDHGGEQSLYEAVIAAYSILKDYNMQFSRQINQHTPKGSTDGT
jgi:hypothetical protein